jgi:NitT/TauT family transport system ATP-binding protein
MPETAIVEFNDVSKRFGEGPDILQGVSFKVAPGEFVSIIGGSGSGKSTLLRLVAGLSPISSGTLKVSGQSPESSTVERACVFQDPTLLPWARVAANVELPLRLRHAPPTERNVSGKRALELVGLADRADAYPRQLSGGQRMRVSLARALTLSPRILLLDEPFGALDEMTRERLNEELMGIRRLQGWSALFVTHSVPEAVFLADRVIVLGGSPARVAADIRVTLSDKRDADTRLTPEFGAAVATVTQALRRSGGGA